MLAKKLRNKWSPSVINQAQTCRGLTLKARAHLGLKKWARRTSSWVGLREKVSILFFSRDLWRLKLFCFVSSSLKGNLFSGSAGLNRVDWNLLYLISCFLSSLLERNRENPRSRGSHFKGKSLKFVWISFLLGWDSDPDSGLGSGIRLLVRWL